MFAGFSPPWAVAVAWNICCTGFTVGDTLHTRIFDVFCYQRGKSHLPSPSHETFRAGSARLSAYRHDGCAVCGKEYAKGSHRGPSFALIDSWIGRKPIKFGLSTAPPEAPRSRPAGVARTSHALPDFRASAKVPVAGAAQ